MNIKFFIFGLLSGLLFSIHGHASKEAAAVAFIQPDKMDKSHFLTDISVNKNDAFNFIQNPLPELFQLLHDQEGKTVIGASQSYHNGICLATISYFYPNLGRLSNTKIKRYLKESTNFQITHQDSTHTDTTRFHYMAGDQKDQTDVLMATAVHDNILQVRTTCQPLPHLTQKENRKKTIFWTKDLAQKTLENLKNGQ